MDNKTFTMFFIGFLSLCASALIHADEKAIVLAADEWCPYNCSPEDKARPGYMVEIAQAVFGKAGYRVEYKVMPFQRALQEVLKGSVDGAIAVDSETEKEALEAYLRTSGKVATFAKSGTMAVTRVSFFTASGTPWVFDPANPEASIKALGGKVGVPKGYSYDISPMLKKMDLLVEISADAPMEQLLKMLDSGKVKAVIDDDAVIQYVAGNIGLGGKVRFAGAAGDSLDCFIGFNAVHKDYAELLDKGVAEMRANGELTKIMQKYNMQDWKHAPK
jgi:polar amino acid transport system substrate-binding protein